MNAFRRSAIVLAAVLLVASQSACQRRRAVKPTARKVENAPPPKVDLPRLTPPAPLPAARVVNLLYTANVVGDAEPCG